MRLGRALAAVAAPLLLAACIENHVSVDIFTQLHADGSCTRRITYRVERIDTDKGGVRVAIPPAEDPLRLFRLPTGEPWRVEEDAQTGLHEITVEALLPSAAAVGGDWWHARSKKAQPAGNAVSAFADAEHGVYEYQELLRDPASPLAGARLLARLAARSDGRFAKSVADGFEEGAAPREGDLRRLFRERLAEPLAREVALLAERPFFGPRERRELEELLGALDAKQRDLASAIELLATGTPPADVQKATDEAMNQLSETILGEIEEAGLPLLSSGAADRIRFHARLMLPAPILRANTCFTGDTAEWDFDEDDLFGRGFEMKALAAPR